jgi:glycolate oxidase iron-sulfur subunit
VASVFDEETITATVKVLNYFGYAVHMPEYHTCCGAIDRHAGFTEQADNAEEINSKLFAKHHKPVIMTSSGCQAVMQDYQYFQQTTELYDVSSFLLNELDNKKFIKFEQEVDLFLPCTMRNKVKNQQDVTSLLEKFGVKVNATYGKNGECCGSSGTYAIKQKAMSRRILNQTMNSGGGDTADNARPLLVPNVGCQMQLATTGRQVMHPITMIWRLISQQNVGK